MSPGLCKLFSEELLDANLFGSALVCMSASTEESYVLKQCSGFQGAVTVPGSKSIANRALLAAALSRGTTQLEWIPGSDDVQVLLRTLPELGIIVQNIKRSEAQPTPSYSCDVVGAAGPFPVSSGTFQLENAGTAVRPLVALLCASTGSFTIDGNEQMRRRPVGDLVDALKQAGLDVAAAANGAPPVKIQATGLKAREYKVRGQTSSQFISALLMAIPLSQELPASIEVTDVPVSLPYIDLTIQVLKDFGVSVSKSSDYRRFEVDSGGYVAPGQYRIEGDATAATYFFAAGAMPGSGPVTVHGVSSHSVQGDVAFLSLLEKMGAQVSREQDSITVQGPAQGSLQALDVDMNSMPDAAMTMAVLALFASGPTRIYNIANLRVKESERIVGLHKELVKLGASVEETHDSLHITPPDQLLSACIETYADHRMAMAFALAQRGCDLKIKDPVCVNKTYPGFFDDWKKIAVI